VRLGDVEIKEPRHGASWFVCGHPVGHLVLHVAISVKSCVTGYTGSDCSKKTSEESLNYSPALLGLIITLFIIVCALAAGLLFMIRQISAYKEDMAHYQLLLQGQEESSHGVVVYCNVGCRQRRWRIRVV
jgi:hypothetical protein